ncbi:chemosensory receptor a [Plakobranchus ocellatus]|uniref:Chemosensory receptor a n=1 Tax=Plakobranchus ocellatus TaxID=259542 RepID=A0AAV4CCM1_9GAST|nr:chemosensory receptor a [Plakobranchus ocellatus]
MLVINTAAFIDNSLNIAVFVKLGFSEPSNISLTALAATDLALVVLTTWTNLCILFFVHGTSLPFHPTNIAHVSSGPMYAFASRTVAWVTAFIRFERCLCILLPLKVEKSMTRRSTLMIITLTFVPLVYTYIGYEFVWVFYPHLNATILDALPIDEEYFVLFEKTITIICGVIQPILAFSIVPIYAVFLVDQLKKISSWRKSVTSAKGQ